MTRARTLNIIAIVLATAAVLTAIWPNWIELAFRVDPDQGSGALEWGLVATFAVLALSSSLVARRARRQMVTSPRP